MHNYLEVGNFRDFPLENFLAFLLRKEKRGTLLLHLLHLVLTPKSNHFRSK